MKAGICGIQGRMGRSILAILEKRGHSLAAAFDITGQGQSVSDSTKSSVNVNAINMSDIKGCTVLLDFSTPEASMELLPMAVKSGTPIVIGTTGFSEKQKGEIEKAGTHIPVLFSPNMAVGVNVLFGLTQIASAALGKDFDAEILELHHNKKKDAPSGTAMRLAEIIKQNMRGMNDAKLVTGRNGITGERSSKEIGLMSLRGGDAVGDHTVYFIGQGERLELSVRSSSRETLANGAVLAAEFIENKRPGLYSMFDVLGLQ